MSGDIADWINDQLYDPFIDGTPEYFLDPVEDGGNAPAWIACKFCGAGPLWWTETEAQVYRLTDGKRLHECQEYRSKRLQKGAK